MSVTEVVCALLAVTALVGIMAGFAGQCRGDMTVCQVVEWEVPNEQR